MALLKGISDYTHGIYYFVENKDQIPEAFGDCIGGLLSVVGQNVFLSVEGASGANVTQVISGFKTEKDANGAFTVNLGDLQSEEVCIKRRQLISLGKRHFMQSSPSSV